MSLSVRPQDPELKSRALRHRDTRRKLSSILFESMSRMPGVAVVGSDPLVNYLATSVGLEPASLATCQAMLDVVGPVTIVGVPSRLWYRRDAMERLRAIKDTMAAHGRACVLIPQPAIVMLERGLPEASLGHRTEVLVKLIRDSAGMGVEHSCCGPSHADPIGCRAMQLLTGNGCRA